MRNPSSRSIVTFLAWTVSTIVVLGASGAAHAACNTPPTPDEVATARAATTAMASAATLSGFTSSTATIDSPFLMFDKQKKGLPRTITAASMTGDASEVLYIAFIAADGSGGTNALYALRKNCPSGPAPTCANGVATGCKNANPSFDAAKHALTFELPKIEESGTQRVGYVRLAVTTESNPCWLAGTSVNDVCTAASHPGLVACLDHATAAGSNDRLTALPLLNDFSNICSSSSEPPHCKGYGNGRPNRLEIAVDAHGDMVIPMDWSDLLKPCPPGNPHCAKRNVYAETTLPRTSSTIDRINLNGDDQALETFAPDGGNFAISPPEFQAPPKPDVFALSGTIDEPTSVLRIRRCPTSNLTCSAADSYFELGDRTEAKIGPVVIELASNNKGYCKDGTIDCMASQDCVALGVQPPCKRVGGSAGNFLTSGGPAPDGGSGAGIWILIILVIGGLIVFLWVRRNDS